MANGQVTAPANAQILVRLTDLGVYGGPDAPRTFKGSSIGEVTSPFSVQVAQRSEVTKTFEALIGGVVSSEVTSPFSAHIAGLGRRTALFETLISGVTTAGIIINNVDLDNLGVSVRAVTGAVDSVTLQKLQAISGAPGVVLLADHVVPRILTLFLGINADPVNLPGIRDTLITLFHQENPCKLTIAIAPTRQLVAEFLEFNVDTQQNIEGLLWASTWDATLRLRVPDPYWRETSTTTRTGITTSAVDIPQGTGPAFLRCRIKGPATNPTVELLDHASNVVQMMAFTVTLGSSDYLVIDGALRMIHQNTTGLFGSGAIATGVLSGGSFLLVSPQYSRRLMPAWPKVRVTNGTMDVFYEMAWSS